MQKKLTDEQIASVKASVDAGARQHGWSDKVRNAYEKTILAIAPSQLDNNRYAPLRQEPDEDLRERVFQLEQRVDRIRQQPRSDAASALYDQNGEVRCEYPHTVAPTAEETTQFLKRLGYDFGRAPFFRAFGRALKITPKP